LLQYFASERTRFDLTLDLISGTAFQRSVWQQLLHIAPGTTCSYGAISQRIGQPSAARAVGAAIGRNPISIIVPCHRVVGVNGAMTGYAGGIDRKIALLQLESTI
jgi:methylated-DNA-[protein]-cysteine S-methyltransferase